MFDVNFGNAKELTLPDEGTYTLVVSGYELKEAKNPESRSKGFNIALTFDIEDCDEFPNVKVYHNLWVHKDNPWAAKLFFEALTGKDLENEQMDLSDPDEFIGDRVGAHLIKETYTNSAQQEKTKLTPESFFSVD
jgi:hypothetical protein